MASDYDRWMFLLTVASLPLACSDDTSASSNDSTGTTAAPTGTSTTISTPEGSTSLGTVDMSSGSSTAVDSGTTTTTTDPTTTGSTDTGSSSGTTTTGSGTTGSGESSESSSSTGAPLGPCEQWATAMDVCYPGYGIPYLTTVCYDYVNDTDPMCQGLLGDVISCQTVGGCFANCMIEDDALEACEDEVLADMLGCDMIPMVPAVGSIAMQCGDVATQATACDLAGYYISGFSQYVGYDPQYMIDFCTNGAYFTFPPPPPGIGDTCGGAYEELLTCLSTLSCVELSDTVIFNNYCTAEIDALTCRCELGA